MILSMCLMICYCLFRIFKSLHCCRCQSTKQQSIEMQNIIDTDKKITQYVQDQN